MCDLVGRILGRPCPSPGLATPGKVVSVAYAYPFHSVGSLTLTPLPHRLAQVILKSSSIDLSQTNASDHSRSKQSDSSQESSSGSSEITNDVFISYIKTDQAWVRAKLLPDLKNERLRVFDRLVDFELGAPIPDEFDRAVLNSRKTLLVLTPAALKDDYDWIERAAQQINYLDPAHRERRLLLLELEPCQLPRSVNYLVSIDFTDERYRQTQFKRLVRAINYTPHTWVPRLVDRLVIQYPVISSWLVMVSAMLGLVSICAWILASLIQLNSLFTATATPTVSMPDNFFNIAVAQFVAPNPTGQMTVTPEGLAFSQFLADAIRNKAEQLGEHKPFVWGPDKVEAIFGENPATRAKNAAQVADHRLKATILIYGVITPDNGGYRAEPEFYISTEGFSYGSEITGASQLGQPMFFDLASVTELKSLSADVENRLKVLLFLIGGLYHYYYSEYDDAWAEFFQASKAVEECQDNQGKEIVSFLMGMARLRQYRCKADPPDIEPLDDAWTAFWTAYQQNPCYARNYLGLGAVNFQLATVEKVEDREKLLNEAEKWYTLAKESDHPEKLFSEAEKYNLKSRCVPDQLEVANLDIKSAYNMGQVYQFRYEQCLHAQSENQAQCDKTQAQQDFFKVIKAYEDNKTPDLAWFAGHAHASLGWLARLEGNWADMSAEFNKAIAVLEELPRHPPKDWIAFYWRWVAVAEKQQGHIDAARNAYLEAIRLGEQIPEAEVRAFDPGVDLDKWRDELNHLKQ